MEDPEGEIPKCNGEETQVLTVLHETNEPIKFFGTVIGEMTATSGGVNAARCELGRSHSGLGEQGELGGQWA